MIPIAMRGIAIRTWLPIWLGAFLTVPPPFDLDIEVARWMQSLSSSSTGVLLDWFGILHLREGNLFEGAGKRFFVEEGCSGVQSFLTLSAVAVFWSIATRSTWFSSVLTLVSAILIALTMNVTRLLMIIVAYVKWRLDLTSGWPHELLGISLFAVGLLGIVSCHQWWRFWFDPIPEDSVPTRTLDTRTDLSIERANANGNGRLAGWCRCMAICLISAFGFVEIGLMVFRSTDSVSQVTSTTILQSLSPLDEDDLPESICGWKRTKFSEVQRNLTYGKFSRRWSYEAPFGQVVFSCDFPFKGDHLLYMCYENAGWKKAAVKHDTAMSATSDFRVNFFHRGLCEHGFLIFNLWDSRGEPHQESFQQTQSGLLQRFLDIAAARFKEAPVHPMTYQFQVFVISDVPLKPAELTTVRAAYVEARDQIRARFRTPSKNFPSA
jgi:exosortase/archaeosortase family protein